MKKIFVKQNFRFPPYRKTASEASVRNRGCLKEGDRGKPCDRGFTLIELLVVIAVIGLMVVIVIVNMQSPRARAHDTNIMRFMHQLRNIAQLSYNQNETYEAVCDETDNTLSNSKYFGLLEDALEKENPGEKVTCFESVDKKGFAASFPLVAEKGKHWCVEAAGAGVKIDNPITSASCK